MMRLLSSMFFLAAFLPSQDGLRIAGKDLAGPVAEFDPLGALVVRGIDDDGTERSVVLRFPELQPPKPGSIALPAKDVTLLLDDVAMRGTVEVRELDDRRVVLQARLRGPGAADDPAPDIAVEIGLPAARPAPVIRGLRPLPQFAPPRDELRREDLVFCALGNTGTGDEIQRRIGATLARLNATGPLDFVLLLGDNFLPAGVATADDPQFRTGFEIPYPDVHLPCPFHAVLGDRDHRGREDAQPDHARGSPRFRMPHLAYQFSMTSHGVEFLFVGIDTTHFGGDVGNPAMRFTSRVMNSAIAESKAKVKIVFGHHSMHGHGPEGRETKTALAMRERTKEPFALHGVTMYIAGGEHHLELVQPKDRPLEVVSGTGGGLVRGATVGEDTLFAAAVPGFTWFRFDGKQLEISFRDQDGKVLYVHRIEVGKS